MLPALLLLSTPTRIARIADPQVDESSGLAVSRRYADVLWTHNDSGDRARIFALDREGATIGEPSRKKSEGIEVDGAGNVDWEDLAFDGDTLYLCDTGNNGNARRDLCVYAVPEPNPRAVARTRPYARYPVRYPDQTAFPPEGDNPFDCEAVFWLRGKLYFLTKWRQSPNGLPLDETALYRMDTRFTDRPNVLRRLDARGRLGGWVTAADVSPDGRTLAVLCHFPSPGVWLFDARRGGDRFLSGPARRIALSDVGQCESLAYDRDGTILVGNEGGELFRLVP